MQSRQARKRVFDAAALRTLEEIFDSTWAIVQARHPFRDLAKDNELREQVRRKLFLVAETAGRDDLDALQQAVLESASRLTRE